MSRPWPPAVQRVAEHLDAARAEGRVEELLETTATAADAARAVGCALPQIVKSLVFSCDRRLVVALVPGDRRADPRKVAAAAGAAKASVVPAHEVEAATGFAPGAVAPFPLDAEVVLERTLLTHDRVWAGAGSERHLVCLPPAELARLARARAADLVEGPGGPRR